MNAADAVQETFIRVYNNIGSFDDRKPFKPWFYRILLNECSRILRKNSKTVSVDDFAENGIHITSSDEYPFEEYESLYKAIENLEDINRIPIILKYLKGLTENQIAEVLDTNINTVKSRLFKGRQKLKKFLQIFEGDTAVDNCSCKKEMQGRIENHG
jgi:RNA polymerase sigma factor, sigma-70 family